MTKQVSSPNSVTSALSVSRPFAVALLGLGMASFVFAPAQTSLGAKPTNTPTQEEESVLVATRELGKRDLDAIRAVRKKRGAGGGAE